MGAVRKDFSTVASVESSSEDSKVSACVCLCVHVHDPRYLVTCTTTGPLHHPRSSGSF